jgi:Flp pilus assembly pilin Flp
MTMFFERFFERIRLLRERPERAATAIEYATIAALVVGGMSLVLGGLAASTSNELDDRGDRIGNPDEYVAFVDPGGDAGGVVGDDIADPPDPVVAVHLEDLTNRRSTGLDPKWQASVDIEIGRNIGPEPAPGVQVLGQWRIVAQSGSTKIQPVDCVTDTNGVCTMTAGGLRLTGNKDQEAWFEYASIVIDPTIYSWNPADDTTAYGTPPAVLVCDPNSTLATDPITGVESCT